MNTPAEWNVLVWLALWAALQILGLMAWHAYGPTRGRDARRR